MNDQAVLIDNLLIHQKILHVRTLVARKLNDLPNLLIGGNGTITGEILFEGFQDALQIEIVACLHIQWVGGWVDEHVWMEWVGGWMEGGTFNSVCGTYRGQQSW